MAFKIILALCVMVTIAAAIPAQAGPGGWPGAGWQGAGGVNPWIPSWIAAAPWYPQWTPCTTVGSSCIDCNTRLVCTKVGGLQRACSDPTLPYCTLGECTATPSEDCSPDSAAADNAA